MDERPPALRLLQRREAGGHLGDARADPQPEPAQPAAEGGAGGDERLGDEQRQHELGASTRPRARCACAATASSCRRRSSRCCATVRLDRARPRVLPAVLRLVQRRASPLRHRAHDARRCPPRPRRGRPCRPRPRARWRLRRNPGALRAPPAAAARATDPRLDQQAQRQTGCCSLVSRRHRLIRLDRLRQRPRALTRWTRTTRPPARDPVPGGSCIVSNCESSAPCHAGPAGDPAAIAAGRTREIGAAPRGARPRRQQEHADRTG